jgi:acyl-CoA dehydrogenase
MAGRVRHPIDQTALEAYLTKHVPAIACPLKLQQFSFGQSNPTYLLTDSAGARFVLRKKPPGKLVSRTAHRVEREYRIIHALAASPSSSKIPVPATYCLCEDESVLGSAWYVMEFLDGRIFEDFAMPGVGPEERAALWRDAIRTLARFHAVDIEAVGLGNFGKVGGFYERQLTTWTAICEAQAKTVDVDTKAPVGKLPHMDELVQFFGDKARQPVDVATLVHGDFKIDNLVFHKTEPRVIGILDWEMATIGHPLSDICNFLMKFWGATATTQPANQSPQHWSDERFRPGATPGLPSREQLLAWYAVESHAAHAQVQAETPRAQTRPGLGFKAMKAPRGYDPTPEEVAWGMAFTVFRGA